VGKGSRHEIILDGAEVRGKGGARGGGAEFPLSDGALEEPGEMASDGIPTAEEWAHLKGGDAAWEGFMDETLEWTK
jgi:hypothetical protein